MVDMHSHIIYGIDDGSKSKEMTLEMLKLSIECGVKKIAVSYTHLEPAEEVYKGSVVLTNVERGNNEKVLVGAMFILLDENLDKMGDIYTTNEQGQITVDNLIEGDYYFIDVYKRQV